MEPSTPTSGKTGVLKKAKAEFTKIRKMTLRKLNQFKQSGQSLAISCYALGEGNFVSFVEDIYKNGLDEIVVLKWYDNNNLASLTHVFVEEIVSISPVKKR